MWGTGRRVHRISPRSNDNYTMPRPDVSIRACHRKAAHTVRIEHFTQSNTESSGHGHALHCTHHPRAVRRGAAHISRTLTRAWISYLCASLRRPFLRRLSRTLRPAFVLIRWKLCVRARLRRFGCHVRFGIAWTFSGVGASGWSGICGFRSPHLIVPAEIARKLEFEAQACAVDRWGKAGDEQGQMWDVDVM